MKCPNKNTDSWRYLVENLGENGAYKIYLAAGEELLPLDAVKDIVKEIKQDIQDEKDIKKEQIALSNVKTILSKINTLTTDRYQKILIYKLQQLPINNVFIYLQNNETYKSSTSNEKSKLAAGYYHNINKEIYLNNSLYSHKTALHEIIHAATYETIHSNNTHSEKWNKLFNDIKSTYKEDAEFMEMHGMTNTDKFISELFTNQKFISKLKSLPSFMKKDTRTLWDEVINVLRQIIGLSKDNLYVEALEQAINIIETPLRNDIELKQIEEDFIQERLSEEQDTVLPAIKEHVETVISESKEELPIPLTTEAQLTINSLINRIKSIRSSMSKNPDKVEIYNQKIKELKEEIENVRTYNSIDAIVGVMIPNRLSYLERQVNESSSFTANDITQMNSELAVWERLIDDFSTPPTVNKPTVIYNDEILQEIMLPKLSSRIKSLHNKLLIINKNYLMTNTNPLLMDKFAQEDLEMIKDTGVAIRYGLDLSRTHDKLAKAIDGYLKRSDRSVMSEYNHVNNRINNIVKRMKNEGYDLTKESVRKLFFQLDQHEKSTTQLVDMFTQSYYNDVNKLTKLKRKIINTTNIKYRNKAIKKWRTWENANRVVIDPTVFFAKEHENFTQSQQDKTKAFLEKELGKETFDKFYKDAEKTWEKWLLDSTAQKIYFIRETNIDDRNAKLSEEEKEKISSLKYREWERINSPIEKMNILKGSSSAYDLLLGKGDSYLVYAPKLSTEYYDKGYIKIQSTPILKEFYDMYKEIMNTNRSYLPYLSQHQLQSNYIPELSKSLTDLMSESDLHKNDIKDKLIAAISAEEADITSYEHLDEYGKPTKRIPIRYVQDNVTRLQRRIDYLDDRKDYLENRIDYLTKITKGKKPDIDKLTLQLKQCQTELSDTIKQHSEAIRNKSTDLVQGLKIFTLMALNYKHKSAVEDVILIGKRVMDEAVALQVTANGEGLRNKEGGLLTLKNGAVHLKESTEYAINALLYGEKRSPDTLLKNKIYKNEDDRKKAKDLRKQIRLLEYDFYSDKITEVEFEKQYEPLSKQLNEIEGANNISATKIADVIVQYTQLKGIGYNPTGAATNITMGLISNSVYAGANKEFGQKENREAYGIMLNSTRKSFGLGQSNISKKINSAMERFGIMFDLNESAYGAKTSVSEKYKKLGILIPYELQRRGEYFVQGQVLIAMMLKKKITVQKDGKDIELRLWDVFDDNMNWKSEYGKQPENWNDLVLGTVVNEHTKFRDSVIQTIKRIHGNYDPSSPIEIKKHILGRMLMQFRSWIPEGVATRFEKENFDEQLGRVVKGRYRSIADIGYANAMRLFVKGLFAKEGGKGLSKLKNDIDIENMKKNIIELRWLISILLVGLILSFALGAEDDDDEQYLYALRLLINQSSRLQNDITFYLSPNAFEQIIRNPIPIMKTYTDAARFIRATTNVVMKDDKIYDSDYWLRNFARMFPLGTNIISTGAQATKILGSNK